MSDCKSCQDFQIAKISQTCPSCDLRAEAKERAERKKTWAENYGAYLCDISEQVERLDKIIKTLIKENDENI